MSNRRDFLNFEISVYDFVEENHVLTAKEAKKIASALHESLEQAIMDYCDDYGIKGYKPDI